MHTDNLTTVYCDLKRRFSIVMSHDGQMFAPFYIAPNKGARFGEEMHRLVVHHQNADIQTCIDTAEKFTTYDD